MTGTVADVAPYLTRARVALAPLRSGGGTRLKILEALDSGRPVISTSCGADGHEDLIGSGVLVEDEPSLMAETVVKLLSDPKLSAELGSLGRLAVAQRHSWEATLSDWAKDWECEPGGTSDLSGIDVN